MTLTLDEADALLAQRVESSRQLGGNPELSMHGGGNTSVKVMREGQRVLHVKGSGWDLATMEPQGMPGLWLDPLFEVKDGPRLSDTEMVGLLRANLLDPAAPNPSVETLLHGYLPARFVDHGHASAVLALASRPEAEQREMVEALFGDSMVFLPYVFPGFDLSIEGARAAAAQPQSTVMWLAQHGLFTWGDTADESLGRFRDAVAVCEAHLAARGAALMPPTAREGNAVLEALRPHLRSALPGFAEHELRGAEPLARLSGQDGMAEAVSRGTVTPDHVIRIKPWPMVIPADADAGTVAKAAEAFAASYTRYFEAHTDGSLTMLDRSPRVVFVPGAGVIGLGRNKTEARINADLAEQNLRVAASAEALGGYQPLPRHEQFRIEYWELEQAKLRK
ncbi:class II aldolase/adducin family protein [Salipiger bermudensis]|uniref:Short chain dehydrogenase n=1 Tax=Salipiger bermudensis (strain DSM 26914 / JCM 13377 / KCTC 12554 / HTCC2601) TaxID=314265 RepID=Q0FWX0_SALBH|nr:class II aldolase/adducin family protein [Salipiger bermudensis]EAU48432.1 short chain dehydrogenase [Salipiger bermudensis HTCC2601]